MRFPLRDEDHEEIEKFRLRSSCQHCAFYLARTGRCVNEWPVDEQDRWPLDGSDGRPRATEIALCKEFELR